LVAILTELCFCSFSQPFQANVGIVLLLQHLFQFIINTYILWCYITSIVVKVFFNNQESVSQSRLQLSGEGMIASFITDTVVPQ